MTSFSRPVLCAFDVHYEPALTRVAAVEFFLWSDAAASREHILELPAAEPYVPGEFYRRELPPILALLDRLETAPDILVLDSHVWLAPGQPGLGARLRDALKGRPAVVGVAKSAFQGADRWQEVQRGSSQQPLFVDAAGLTAEEAAAAVRSMHGPFRVPTLLRRVDRLARGQR